jgi:hypothetical protein
MRVCAYVCIPCVRVCMLAYACVCAETACGVFVDVCVCAQRTAGVQLHDGEADSDEDEDRDREFYPESTALYAASICGHSQVARVLLGRGARVDLGAVSWRALRRGVSMCMCTCTWTRERVYEPVVCVCMST